MLYLLRRAGVSDWKLIRTTPSRREPGSVEADVPVRIISMTSSMIIVLRSSG
jgi:hypothetical protein